MLVKLIFDMFCRVIIETGNNASSVCAICEFKTNPSTLSTRPHYGQGESAHTSVFTLRNVHILEIFFFKDLTSNMVSKVHSLIHPLTGQVCGSILHRHYDTRH
jgi:hypothetical protein